MSINRSLHKIAKEGVVQTLEAKDKEIEKYYNGEVHVDFEDEYEKMNEYELRLILKSADELIKNDSKEIRVLRDENKRLHNIIKEVREYTKSHFKEMVADEEAQKLLEILDKENK